MPNWEERIAPQKLADRTAFDHDMYGVEIEVEYNASLDTNIQKSVQQFWSVVNDGSLRTYGKSGDFAYEFRYTKPLNSFTSAVAVKQLCHVLNTETKEIYNSGRTSTHVHVNVCNINRLQIMNLITLSIIFDEFLVAQHHPFRSGNLFALRYVDAEWPIRFLVSSVSGPRFRNFTNGNHRYASVNLASIGTFGTIEFRAMDGELNSQRINQWVFCLHQLKRRASEYKNPREIIERFHKMGASAFLADHIPSYYVLNTPSSRSMEMMSRGIIMAADLAYSSDWVSSIDVNELRGKGGSQYSYVNTTNAAIMQQMMEAEQQMADAQTIPPPVPSIPSIVFSHLPSSPSFNGQNWTHSLPDDGIIVTSSTQTENEDF